MSSDRIIRALYINVLDGTCSVINVSDTLDEYYRLIDCETFDITCRYINGKKFNIMCDDFGFINGKWPSALRSPVDVILVGNLLVFSGDLDGDGNLQSLSNDDIIHLSKCLGLYFIDNIDKNIEFLQYPITAHSVVMLCGIDNR